MSYESFTIVAPITPVITSAVILLRVSGSDALKVFTLIRDVAGKEINPTPNHVYFAKFYAEDKPLDDILVTYFKSPKSFTGEDSVELSFHGNPIIIGIALNECYKLGFINATNGEFSKRAFLNNKISLDEAEAIQELIASKSEISLDYAYNQLNGSVSKYFNDIKDKLLDIKAIVEAKIDFPDEDTVDEVKPIVKGRLAEVINEFGKFIESYKQLRILSKDINIIITGRPNVGKSSLLNLIVDKDRAIVSDIAGTTRDYITESTMVDGIPVLITDTAGVRNSDNELEQVGIKRSIEKVSVADLILLLIDTSSELTDDDNYLLSITEDKSRLIIGSKSDKHEVVHNINYDIKISNSSKDSINRLIKLIKERITLSSVDIDGVVTLSERHAFIAKELLQILTSLLEKLDNIYEDMLVVELDIAISKLSEISGEQYTEDILSVIFNKFCIGK